MEIKTMFNVGDTVYAAYEMNYPDGTKVLKPEKFTIHKLLVSNTICDKEIEYHVTNDNYNFYIVKNENLLHKTYEECELACIDESKGNTEYSDYYKRKEWFSSLPVDKKFEAYEFMRTAGNNSNKIISELATHLLGKNFFIASSVSTMEANKIIRDEIFNSYKKVDKEPGKFKKIINLLFNK